MELNIFQIDAFTDSVFKGNPAAVVILNNPIRDDIMQKIASENNLAETAFLLMNKDIHEIRWFTPTVEVDLCGHATLASAFVLYNFYGYSGNKVDFYSPRSGHLIVYKNEDSYTLDFPVDELVHCEMPELLFNAFNGKPVSCQKGKTDLLIEFSNEDEIQSLKPDLQKIKAYDGRGIIVTAPGSTVDFVSRFFAPQSGIDEDPVTGSAHTSLTPFWAGKLNKTKLTAEQLSKRGGKLFCELSENRVLITGEAALFLKGTILI